MCARVTAQYLEKVSLFLVAGGEELRRRVVSEQRVQSSAWKEGHPEEEGCGGEWWSADVQLLCSPFMTYCWIKYDVRNSQNQISHLQDCWPHIHAPDSQVAGVCANARQKKEKELLTILLWILIIQQLKNQIL